MRYLDLRGSEGAKDAAREADWLLNEGSFGHLSRVGIELKDLKDGKATNQWHFEKKFKAEK